MASFAKQDWVTSVSAITGALIHVDVTKFGNIPDGGGHRYVGRQQGDRNRSATAERTGGPRNQYGNPLLGKAFVHTVIDDYSRLAYAEICADETAVTAIGVLQRAVAWFAARGVTVESVLSDNGSCYRSHAWRDTCTALNVTHKRTRPYRPQINGKKTPGRGPPIAGTSGQGRLDADMYRAVLRSPTRRSRPSSTRRRKLARACVGET